MKETGIYHYEKEEAEKQKDNGRNFPLCSDGAFRSLRCGEWRWAKRADCKDRTGGKGRGRDRNGTIGNDGDAGGYVGRGGGCIGGGCRVCGCQRTGWECEFGDWGKRSSHRDARETLSGENQALLWRHTAQVMAVYQLPDMELGVGVWGKDTLDAGEMAENCFAVADVDQDGREELLVRWTTTTTAGSLEVVYDYNPVSGELKNEFCAYPLLTYYDNGVIKAGWSHNQVPPAEFWPCTFYQFEPEENSYVEIGSLRAWDDIGEEWDFPTERDVDGDGTVYEMVKAGEEYSDYDSDYEGFQFNQADVDEWLGGFMEGAQEIPLVYYPMKHESFADFTPAYLRMLAAEAGKERTDTASDLGLFILNEEYFLDVAQTLLSEKYGVVMEQPDPAFEEWTVGSKDGKELFSFEALNAGHIGYKGERFEDVTIFGIYPGMRVDSAWEKLQAYGFYASSYAEVENCLITGEGFGNISIWFSAEDNVVTDITVGPYCAFAG